jgi:hypothetical protein
LVRSRQLLKASCVIEGKANMCSYRLEAKVRGRAGALATGHWHCAARHRIAARPRHSPGALRRDFVGALRGMGPWLRGRYDAEKRKW